MKKKTERRKKIENECHSTTTSTSAKERDDDVRCQI